MRLNGRTECLEALRLPAGVTATVIDGTPLALSGDFFLAGGFGPDHNEKHLLIKVTPGAANNGIVKLRYEGSGNGSGTKSVNALLAIPGLVRSPQR